MVKSGPPFMGPDRLEMAACNRWRANWRNSLSVGAAKDSNMSCQNSGSCRRSARVAAVPERISSFNLNSMTRILRGFERLQRRAFTFCQKKEIGWLNLRTKVLIGATKDVAKFIEDASSALVISGSKVNSW